jgi:hypothetical protein
MSETNPTKICDLFRLGCLLFICQTSNLDQDHVKGQRNVPIHLLLIPLIYTRGQKKGTNAKNPSISFPAWSMAHQPTDTFTTVFRMRSMCV